MAPFAYAGSQDADYRQHDRTSASVAASVGDSSSISASSYSLACARWHQLGYVTGIKRERERETLTTRADFPMIPPCIHS